MPRKLWVLAACFILLGSGLRVLLYVFNPPLNAYDDHFEPVMLWIRSGARPAADACWECHQPPVFYGLAALVGKAMMALGVSMPPLRKCLQFLPCLAGILTLPVVLGVLVRLRVRPLAACLALGVLCFLPRHIYMSAMFSNDTLSYLLAALTVWLAVLAIDHGCALRWLVPLSLSLCAAVFTKLTALALLPSLLAGFGWLLVRGRGRHTWRIALRTLVVVFLLPAVLLAAYLVSNKQNYGAFIADIQVLWDMHLVQQPGPERISFIDFLPWRAVATPFLAPDQVQSFWTQVHGRMWFDMEPKFVCFTPLGEPWCNSLYAYLDGVEGADWPGKGPTAAAVVAVGRAMILLGLVPLLLLGTGAGRSFATLRSSWRGSPPKEGATSLMLGVLVLANVAGIVGYALAHPFYSSMKAAYLLLSLPACAVWIGLGLSWCERREVTRWIAVRSLAVLFILASVHVLQIVRMLAGRP